MRCGRDGQTPADGEQENKFVESVKTPNQRLNNIAHSEQRTQHRYRKREC